MSKISIVEIYCRMDKLADKMGGKVFKCESWTDTSDKYFQAEQVHGTFNDAFTFGTGEKVEYAMRCLNDLWKEANK